jgi:hypothetical protein
LNKPNSDQQTGQPLAHYGAVYQSLDPRTVTQRTGLVFDNAASAFCLRILGEEHRALYPNFALLDSGGRETASPYEKILVLRYLCEGKLVPGQGKRLAYNEIPWGEVYYRNFEGRCLKRCAFAFGKDIAAFTKTIEQNPRLCAEQLQTGDAAWRFEFINGLYISLILWGADEEFPPAAQILFDDNLVFAFTAEDLAVLGEVLIDRLKKLQG